MLRRKPMKRVSFKSTNSHARAEAKWRSKKTKANQRANAVRAKQFIESGQDRTCQLRFVGCWGRNSLSWCHPRKRRHLRAGELAIAILGCTPCHRILDEDMTEDAMCELVYKIWNERKAA